MVHTITTERTASLANATDPFSLKALNERISVNGRAFVSVYDAATHQLTTRSPVGRQISSVLDSRGRLVQMQYGGLATRSYIYDLRGRLISAIQGSGDSNRTTSLAYNAGGFLQSITDATNQTSSLARDSNGRITELTGPDGGSTHFGYDANSNVTTLTPPGQPDHTFAYNQNNQVLAYTAPNVGTQNNQTLYTYDLDRDLLAVNLADGQSLSFQYDSAGRGSLVDMTFGDTGYHYDAAGRMATVSREQGSDITYTYDGALPVETTWSGTVVGRVNRIFDNNFLLISLSVNGTNAIELTYDPDGLLIQVGNLILTRSAESGLVKNTALGIVSDTLSYDVFGAPATYAASQNGNAVYSAAYDRDILGRIVTKRESIGGIEHTFTYAYDPASRLTEVRQDGNLTARYSYDANGNRLTRTDSAGPIITAGYDAQDRLIQFGSTTYVHNAKGERQSKTAGGQTTAYQYDTLSNLTGVTLPNATQIEYVLDGQQRRVGKKRNNVLVQAFLYQDDLKPIAELDGSNDVVSRFVYATGVNVPAYMIKAGLTYRIITDHLGSPKLVIDTATGNIAQQIDYDEFGKVTLDTNPGFQPFGFAGGIYDQDTRLVHFGAREFDPETGRWITKDPIGFNGGDGNLYAYAANDPINLVDSAGFKPGDPFNSVEDAAYDALKFIQEKSIKKTHEYGGYIYQDKDGKFKCSPLEMTDGATGGSLPFNNPKGTKVLANVHTHPGIDEDGGRQQDDNRNVFSEEDIQMANKFKIKVYVLNNYGNFAVFDPLRKAKEKSRVIRKGNTPPESDLCDGGEKC